ncbi:MAG: SpoIID/LytB domain-containing protein [Planctomycetes bacterium]|nr:SpoIID/LytB domain-containing protein [Planctomycetota bacterium]
MKHQLIRTADVLLLLAISLCGMISSCHRQMGPVAGSALPVSGRIVRVRLRESVCLVRLAVTGPYRLMVDGKAVGGSSNVLPPTVLLRRDRTWVLGNRYGVGQVVRIEPAEKDTFVQCNGRRYRGSLVIQPVDADDRRFHVDNHVPLEGYLAGVLACELPQSWHIETYEALAVAARTYALYESQHTGRHRSFDVYADQRSQVYGGLDKETPKSLAAVRQTCGQVLAGTDAEGAAKIFKAYYSSCCGGMTSAADGLEPQDQQFQPLSGGVVCQDCAFSGRYRWAPVLIAKTEVYAAVAQCYRQVAQMGTLRAIRIRSATNWGRPLWLDIISEDGRTATIRADDLRIALLRYGSAGAKKLYSMDCTIRDAGDSISFEDGKGFGHGVGLCQYGAEGKARRGMKYYQILRAYYPGAKIMQVE